MRETAPGLEHAFGRRGVTHQKAFFYSLLLSQQRLEIASARLSIISE